MTPGKRKAPSGPQLETVGKLAKQQGTARKLSAAGQKAATENTRRDFTASKAAQTVMGPRRSSRLTTPPPPVALSGLEILKGPNCTAFGRMARGCRTATVTIGPFAGVEASVNSDAIAILPRAITKARETYGKHNIKSGHCINANFRGPGDDYRNMTILTNSANMGQKGFDNAIVAARGALTKAYEAILEGKPKTPDYLRTLGYGIKITITMSDDTWEEDYPGNCIANKMRCEAEVVNAPSRRDLENALGGASKNTKITEAVAKINEVANKVKEVESMEILNEI